MTSSFGGARATNSCTARRWPSDNADVSRCLSLLTPVAASSASSVASVPPSFMDRSRAPVMMLATLSEARPLPQLSCV